MPLYAYKAAEPTGKVVRGSLEAADERGAAGRLQDMGYIPIQIRPAGKSGPSLTSDLFRYDLSKSLSAIFSRISEADVMRFTQDLAALLSAGLPVDRALSVLIDTAEKPGFKNVIREMLRSVQGGSYLSDAMAKHPKAFSEFYVNMVRAGEAGGVLEAVLERLGIFLENSQELKDYIRSALIYPIFLLFVGGISIIILMTFVIPKFSMIFEDMGGAIPLSTKILLAMSGLLRTYWPIILIGTAGIFLMLAKAIKTPAGRRWFDRVKLDLPVAGETIRRIEVARFARTLGTLTKSGVPILQALSLVQEIIGNRIISGALAGVQKRVKEGDRLSVSLGEIGLFPELAVQMITVGEESGRLDQMLLRVADTYEKSVRTSVKRLISLIEPAMILFMGLVVGFIVISMLMAIFSINEIPF